MKRVSSVGFRYGVGTPMIGAMRSASVGCRSILRSPTRALQVPGRRSRALTALAVILALATPAISSAAPSKRKPDSGLERSQAFVEEGDAALERGDYEDAIAKYSAAYYGLDTEDRVSYIGSIPVRQAMRAYDLLVAQEQDRAVLDRQLSLVTEFLENVRSRPDGVDRVGKEVVDDLQVVKEAVEKKIAALSEASAPHSTDAPGSKPVEETTTEPEPVTTTPPNTTPPADGDSTNGMPFREPPSRLGVGLAAAGGVVLGTGAGVMAGWWTVRNQAVEYADAEPGYEEGTTERVDYLEREEARARKYLISGVVVMGVGAAVATTGVVLIAQHRRRGKQAPVAVAPVFDPRHAGLVITGRF